ncbi:MAG: DUF6485 family protein [Thermodesulfovibrionales bacterium]|nr:DUF6485 family protein [Thermodesulfovibrionales bacterium]
MECTAEKNRKYCNCSYPSCSKKLKCCDCLHYHRLNGELPACFFNNEYEKTYDRSVNNFIRMKTKS